MYTTCAMIYLQRHLLQNFCVNTGMYKYVSPYYRNLCSYQNKCKVSVWTYMKDVCITYCWVKKSKLPYSMCVCCGKKTNENTHSMKGLYTRTNNIYTCTGKSWGIQVGKLCLFTLNTCILCGACSTAAKFSKDFLVPTWCPIPSQEPSCETCVS